MTLETRLKFYGVTLTDGSGGTALIITINGRQAAAEGPRRPGQCVYCKGMCLGASAHCELRVFGEARRAP